MKLARYEYDGDQGWGVVDVEAASLQPIEGDITEWGPLVTSGRREVTPVGEVLPLADVRLLPPMAAAATITGVGMNYWSHLEKLGVTERPPSTVGFLKPRAAMIGHEAEMAYPAITKQLDFEIELVAIMGAPLTTGHGRPTDAVLGYTVGNDTSARDTPSPMGGPDLFSMKALDRATPIGPWIVTKDEFDTDPLDLEIALRVNGEQRQRDRTSNMLWNLDECIEYVVARTSLEPGDVVFTGTTDGVAFEDGRWLEPGDVVEAEIEGIGVLRNIVGPRPA